jgi:tetratricopeptide (TPR) repeat protein
MSRSAERKELLEALSRLRSGEAEQEEPLLRFLPLASHRLALRPDCLIVRGARGVGKSALFGVLRELGTSARIRQLFEDDRLPDGSWIEGFSEQSLDHPHTSVIDKFARTATESALRAFWMAHLLRRVQSNLGNRVPLPPFLSPPPLDTVEDPFAWIHGAEQGLHAVAAALDLAERMLQERGQTLFVAYDHLDRLSTFERVVRRRCIGALLGLWLSLSLRYKRLRAKIFLRDDLYTGVAATFPDASKLRSVAIEWEESSLYRVVVRHMVSASPELRSWVAAVPGLRLRDRDDEFGWIPEEMSSEVQRTFAARLVGPTIGKGPHKVHTHRWILNRLQDAQGRVVPRSLLCLIGRAAEQALHEEKAATRERLLRPQDLEAALDETSRQRLNEVTEEYPILRRAENLSRLILPLPRGEVEELLARPVPDEPEQLTAGGGVILEELIGLGVLRLGGDGQVDVADLYRAAYGIRRGVEATRASTPQPTGWVYYEQAQALFEQAGSSDGQEAAGIYRQAIDRYRKALEDAPEFSAAAYQLGRALRKLARLIPSEAAVLRDEARQVFGRITDREPESDEARFQLELTHAEEAEDLPADDVVPVLKKLCARTEDALRNLRAWSQGELAGMTSMPEASALFARAVDLIESAPPRLRLKEHTFELWGRLLCKWAQREDEERARALLDQTEEKALNALQLKPDFSKALNLWGAVPKSRAAISDREAALQMLQISLDRFQMAHLNRRRDARNLLDWSDTLVELALLSEGSAARRFLMQAKERASEALAINRESCAAWNGIGWLRLVNAELFIEDRATVLNDGAAHFEKALSISPSAGAPWAGLGHVRLAEGNEMKAAECFGRADAYRPGAGAYGMARLAAMRGSETECRAELARGFRFGWVPSRAMIARDRLLAGYCSLPWIQEFPFRLSDG